MATYAPVARTVEPGSEQVGVAIISKQLHEGVTKYHAQIGANVPHSELVRLEQKLTKEGSKACYEHQWEAALNCFTHALAVSEKTKSTADPGCRGTFVHNIGFCLHCMGEFDAAKEYYEQAIDCLHKVELPMHTKILNGVLYPERLVFELIYGGLNHNRIQMTRERILDCSYGRKPDLKILDEYGRTKPMPGADKSKAAAEDAAAAQSAEWEREGIAPEWAGPGSLRAGQPGVREGAPGWLASAAANRAGGADVEAPSGSGTDTAQEGAVDARDGAEQEAARKEWLAYHLKVGEWSEAQELVVTAEEQEDLDYLRARALRVK